jgi:hypothetical protein
LKRGCFFGIVGKDFHKGVSMAINSRLSALQRDIRNRRGTFFYQGDAFGPLVGMRGAVDPTANEIPELIHQDDKVSDRESVPSEEG